MAFYPWGIPSRRHRWPSTSPGDLQVLSPSDGPASDLAANDV